MEEHKKYEPREEKVETGAGGEVEEKKEEKQKRKGGKRERGRRRKRIGELDEIQAI